MIYARVAEGFQSGGFNGRANSVAERTEYQPEKVTSYEAGVRSTIAGGLRLNLTGFYNDYRDFQARVAGTGDRCGDRPALADPLGDQRRQAHHLRASRSRPPGRRRRCPG